MNSLCPYAWAGKGTYSRNVLTQIIFDLQHDVMLHSAYTNVQWDLSTHALFCLPSHTHVCKHVGFCLHSFEKSSEQMDEHSGTIPNKQGIHIWVYHNFSLKRRWWWMDVISAEVIDFKYCIWLYICYHRLIFENVTYWCTYFCTNNTNIKNSIKY